MLAVALCLLAFTWALWLMYMIRYPKQWAERIDGIHSWLSRHGLSFEWMKRAEKGYTLKAVVGLTVILTLCSLVVTLRHPDALSNFLRAHSLSR